MNDTPDEVPFAWWEKAKEMLGDLALKLGAHPEDVYHGDESESYEHCVKAIAALKAERDQARADSADLRALNNKMASSLANDADVVARQEKELEEARAEAGRMRDSMGKINRIANGNTPAEYIEDALIGLIIRQALAGGGGGT